jgi:uncharacterized caspase-like protein
VNADDHALVVGIRRYADVNHPSGWIGDLNGPDNDATAVATWLRKRNGGGLPKKNVHLIRSADEPNPFTAAGGKPEQARVKQALEELANLPPTAFEGQYAGRRVYIYVSGHGLAKGPDEAALITADANRADPLNVELTSWVKWLYMAGRFKEYVLWVDCCATRAPDAILTSCHLREQVSGKRGLRFVAYAAAVDKVAVENKMRDRKWHGAFTYTLLQGLEHAGAGQVTTQDLRDFLFNNMRLCMREDQRVRAVSEEPVFGTTDTMSFGAPARKSQFPVTLRFPSKAIGKQATISVNSSSPLTAQTVLKKRDWKVKLEAGTYVAFVPELNHYQPFTITGESTNGVIAIS